jgi:hypothetical protein
MAAEEPINQGAPGDAPSDGSSGHESPLSAAAAAGGGGAGVVDEHPELLVGAAFVGGIALAQILKQFGR